MSSKNYQPKDFFRRAPHDLLVQYFARHEVLTKIEFTNLTDEQIEAPSVATRIKLTIK